MPQRQISFLIALLIATTSLHLNAKYYPTDDSFQPTYGDTPIEAEDRLASGLPIVFEDAGIFELELIDNVSDQRAIELIKKRKEIIKMARKLPKPKKHQAFELAHGIGVKNALFLSQFISLD